MCDHYAKTAQKMSHINCYHFHKSFHLCIPYTWKFSPWENFHQFATCSHLRKFCEQLTEYVCYWVSRFPRVRFPIIIGIRISVSQTELFAIYAYTAVIIMHRLIQITCTTACNECGTIHVAGFCGQYKVTETIKQS